MSKKPTVTTVASGYFGRQALNDNFEALRDAFDNTLSRDGSTPNAMGADLDMNSNDILNVNDISTSSLRLNGVLVSPADLSSAGSVMYSNKFTGDGSTVAYTLSYSPYIKDNTLVYIDGVYQNKDGYAVSGTTLTFSEAPPLNSSVEIVVARTLQDVGTADAAAVTYSQGGTGAVTTTVENKLQEFVSVKDFGAVGDGVTDDTAAIQAAIATGKNVFGQFGDVYRTTSTLTFPATSSTYWQTIDLNMATIKPDGSHNCFTFNTSTGIQFLMKGIRFDASVCTGKILYAPTFIKEFVFEDIVIQSPQGNAIEMVDIFTGRFSRVSVLNAAARSFLAYSNTLGTPVNSIWIEDCNFDGSTYVGDVVALEGAAGCYIKNCSFQGNASGSNDLALKSNANAGINGVYVQGGYWETGPSINGASIYIDGTASADAANVHVVDCYFQTSKVDVSLGSYTDESITVSNSTFVSVTPSAYSSWLANAGTATPRLLNNGGDHPLIAASSSVSIGLREVIYGSGTPEGNVVADVGSIYMRTDTGGTTLYVKEFNGGTNTGWIAQAGWGAVPASAGAAGIAGQMAYDSSYLYICVAANTWRRVAISTW